MNARKYIVLFNDYASPEKITEYIQEIINQGGQVTNNYNMPGFRGFAAIIPAHYLPYLQSVQIQGGVISHIEPDSDMSIM